MFSVLNYVLRYNKKRVICRFDLINFIIYQDRHLPTPGGGLFGYTAMFLRHLQRGTIYDFLFASLVYEVSPKSGSNLKEKNCS